MALYFERGDVTKTHLNYIIHGCNNQGAFASGVAAAIAQAFPSAQKEYFNLTRDLNFTEREELLGKAQIVFTKAKLIGNLFTQGSYGKTGVHAELKYIYAAIQCYINATEAEAEAIASPKIGCGLGGLKWDQVKEVYDEICRVNPRTSFIIYEIG